MTPGTERRWRAVEPWQRSFLLLAAIWGLSFLFIKVGVEAFAPVQVAFGRVLFGVVALLFVLAVRRERLPRELRTWGHLAVVAVLTSTAPFVLFAYGETHVSSILASIWNATTPLCTLLVVMIAFRDERPTRDRLVGLALGFVGVLVVIGIWDGVGGGDLLGSLACLLAALCYGTGIPYTRRHLSGTELSPLTVSTSQLLISTGLLGVGSVLFSDVPSSWPWRSVASVVVLGAVGTGFAYLLFFGVVRTVGATTASSVTYVIPLFSAAAGVLVLGETLHWNQPVGAVVVLLGVAASQGLLGRRRRGSASVETPAVTR